MLYFLFIIVLLLIVGFLIYLATLNGKYSVKQTQLIDADINRVFDKLTDFKSWKDWSPWLIHEPEAQLQFSQDYNKELGYYTWDSKIIGAGKLSHVKFEKPYNIKQKLEFTRPFKSICNVGFELSEINGKTELSWLMDGRMPFLFRFMTDQTQDMISKDYALGLAMLNGLLDAEANRPVLQFLGEITRDPVLSLCQGFEGHVTAMKEAMKTGFPLLMQYVEEQQGTLAGAPYTAYSESDPKAMQFVCDLAIPLAKPIDAGEFTLKTLGGGRYYKVCLNGDYQFLELAWYAAIAHIKMLKLKYDRSRASLEIYENYPEQLSSSNELSTTLYIAIK